MEPVFVMSLMELVRNRELSTGGELFDYIYYRGAVRTREVFIYLFGIIRPLVLICVVCGCFSCPTYSSIADHPSSARLKVCQVREPTEG